MIFSQEFKLKFQPIFLQPYIKNFLFKWIRYQYPPQIITNLLIFVVVDYLNYAYFKELTKINKIYPRLFLYQNDPWIKLFAIAPLLLNSVHQKGGINESYIKIAIKHLQSLYPLNEIPINGLPMFNHAYDYYTNAFRLLQFIKI